MIRTLLDNLQAGKVRLVRCEEVAYAFSRLRDWSEHEASPVRVVLCNWTDLPETSIILDQTLDALARTALALWPHWYGVDMDGSAVGPSDLSTLIPLDRLPPGVFLPWLQAAVRRCQSGSPPRPPKFAKPTHAAQLALAVDPDRLHIVLAQSGSKAEPGSLLDFARAAEWLAKETQARVVVLLPHELAGCPNLDSINFEAVDFPAVFPTRSAIAEEKQSLLVWPFHGNPHPDSPGEQLLAKQLGRDREMAGLFTFNQSVQTVRRSCYTVDLLWQQGKVIVEVDGYGWHSGPKPFFQDRQRDYELVISGHLVLRLTHDEVLEDVALALEKIRDVVAYRRREIQSQGAMP